MIKNENIICISSIDWDFIWQGHQEIMSVFAENNNRVLFIENTGVRTPGIRDIPRIKNRIKNWFSGTNGIRKVQENLYVFSPLVLPFPYARMAMWLNHRLAMSALDKWVKVMDFTNPYIWVFLPTPLSLDIIDNLNAKFVVYYCIDNFQASSSAAQKIKSSETKLLKIADLVFVTSRELFKYCSQYNRRVYNFPFAVNFEEFEKARIDDKAVPAELAKIKGPIIGYVGGIHKWLDLVLLGEMARNCPEYSFVFTGPVQTDVSSLISIKNIYFLGKKKHEDIPYYIKNFDACIIPYLVTDYTKNVYPTKLNEYLAMGKPVVSTGLPEIASFNRQFGDIVLVASTAGAFAQCLKNALRDNSEDSIRRRISTAKVNSWSVKINEMSGLIEGVLKDKSPRTIDWKEGFLRFYRVSQRKFLKAGVIAAGLYLLVFYTNLIWFIANPLKISQIPKQADCIVVFGGGVGESGQVGQGYEERVKYSVDLYKEGFSKNLIFSSGYTYVFKEPEVMKALAISLGIPAGNIFVEEEAKNTYENVIFSKKIMDKYGWKEILMVTSPYHALRVSLVVRKNAKDLKVTYTPLKSSFFYAHPQRDAHGRKIFKRIDLRQIKGVMHEYLGIAYYLKKGWI